MIDIIVQRGAGDHQGDDIVEPLIGGSLPVALARGRAELNENGQPMKEGQLEQVYRDGMRKGQVVRLNDTDQGSFSLVVRAVRHTARKVGDSVQLTTNLRVKRPA